MCVYLKAVLPQLFIGVTLSRGGVEQPEDNGHDPLDVVAEPVSRVATHRPHGLDIGAGVEQVSALFHLGQVSQEAVHDLGVEGCVAADHQVSEGQDRPLADGRPRGTKLNQI